MFEAVIESWQTQFAISRTMSALLVGGITFLAGVFLEEESRTGKWLDAVSIGIVPLGAVLGAYPSTMSLAIRGSGGNWEKGHKRQASAAFGFAAKIYLCAADHPGSDSWICI